MGVIYNTLILCDKSNKESKKTIVKKEIKMWEKNTSVLVIFFILIIIILLMVKFKKITFFYNIVYYLTTFLLYVFVLGNVLIKKDKEKIEKKELIHISSIPTVFCFLYNTDFCKDILNILNNNFRENVVYFIFKYNIKYFIVVFFICLLTFLIIIELKKKIKIKIKYLNSNFDLDTYIYKNSRGKKGIKFLINYLKDIIVLVKVLFIAIIKNIYINSFIYIFIVIKKFIIKLTNNLSIYVIITKTFSFSMIICLLITYYKLLCRFPNNIVINLYAVIITTIIIPIILNTISELNRKGS